MREFKLGDRVSFGGMKGEVKVAVGISPGNFEYPLSVTFDCRRTLLFTEDGRQFIEQTRPVLKHLKKKTKKKTVDLYQWAFYGGSTGWNITISFYECEKDIRINLPYIPIEPSPIRLDHTKITVSI